MQDADGATVTVLACKDAQEAARNWWKALEREETGIAPEAGPYAIADAIRDYFEARSVMGGARRENDTMSLGPARTRCFENGPRSIPFASESGVSPSCSFVPIGFVTSPRRSQGDEEIGQGDVSSEPRHQAVLAIAPGSTAALAVDADDGMRKLTKRM